MIISRCGMCMFIVPVLTVAEVVVFGAWGGREPYNKKLTAEGQVWNNHGLNCAWRGWLLGSFDDRPCHPLTTCSCVWCVLLQLHMGFCCETMMQADTVSMLCCLPNFLLRRLLSQSVGIWGMCLLVSCCRRTATVQRSHQVSSNPSPKGSSTYKGKVLFQ